MRRVLACIAVVAAPAHADDWLTLRGHDTGTVEPVLQLDPTLPLVLEGVHAAHEDDRTRVDLSPRLWIERTSTLWTDPDVGARGWQSRAQSTCELRHGLQLVGLAGYGQVATQFGHDLYFDVGIGILKLFRISRWTTRGSRSMPVSVRGRARRPLKAP